MHRTLVAGGVVGSLFVVLAVCGGCGGGSSGGGESFQQQIEKAEKEPDAGLRAKKLRAIARGQAKAQDKEGSRGTLSRAFTASKAIEDPGDQAQAFADLAVVQADLNFAGDARSSAKSAIEAAEKVESRERKAKAMSGAGRALGVIGDADAAVKVLKETETLAAEIQDSTGRVLTLCSIASGYDKMAKPSEADRVLADALQYAQSLEGEKAQAVAIATVALEQARLKRPAATKTFDGAIETARKAADVGEQVMALVDIAEKTSTAGNAKQAHELLAEAEKKAEKIKAADLQAQMLDKTRKLMITLPKPAA